MSKNRKKAPGNRDLDQLLLYLELLHKKSNQEWKVIEESLLNNVGQTPPEGACPLGELIKVTGSQRFLKMNEFEALRKEIKESQRVFFGHKKASFGHLILPPSEDSPRAVILLGCDWDMTEMDCKFTIEVRIVITGDIDGRPFRNATYRFEAPHCKSIHDYHHMQITEIDDVDWPLDGIPCVPINAGNPVAQLLIAFLSFYGAEWIDEIYRSDSGLCRKYVDCLPESCRPEKKDTRSRGKHGS